MIEDTNKEFFNRNYFPSLAVSILLVVILFTNSGCEFFRKLDKSENINNQKDTTNSGTVKKTDFESKTDSEYSKTTFIPVYPNIPRDSTVINNYFPEQKPQYIVIQEKGKVSEQVKENKTDSSWFFQMKELLIAATTKQSETKASFFSPAVIISICFGVLLLIILLLVVMYMARKFSAINLLLTKIK